MYLIFRGKPTSESECIALQSQISIKGGDILVERGLYRDENNYVVIKEGKQPIERWANVTKAYNQDIWYIPSPKSKGIEYYDELVEGFTFTELETIPEDWYEPREDV